MLDSGSAIMGSAARWVTVPFPNWQPKDLNLGAPRGKAGSIRRFLQSEGWQLAFDQNPLFIQSATIWSFARYMKNNLIVTITETKHDSLFRHTALASHTAGAILLMPTSLLAFYPRDLDAHETVMRLSAICGSIPKVSNADRRRRLKEMDLKVLSRTKPRGRPCGPSGCPGLPRRCRGGRGMGFLRWNMNDSDTLDILSDAVLGRFAGPMYTFGWTFSQCHNVECDYFGLPLF
ncbi:hypothetical protein B0H13DRAFT_1870476 [Mycena leptocephala]|nr:hypothetical protein B0H13DRAFT_1870476 [Mycena leptocephala]